MATYIVEAIEVWKRVIIVDADTPEGARATAFGNTEAHGGSVDDLEYLGTTNQATWRVEALTPAELATLRQLGYRPKGESDG